MTPTNSLELEISGRPRKAFRGGCPGGIPARCGSLGASFAISGFPQVGFDGLASFASVAIGVDVFEMADQILDQVAEPHLQNIMDCVESRFLRGSKK